MNEMYDTLDKIVAYLYAHGDNKIISGVNGVFPKTLLYNEKIRITQLDNLEIKLIEITKTTTYGEINIITEESSNRKLEIYFNNVLNVTARKFLGGRNKSYKGTLTISENIHPKNWEVDETHHDLFKDVVRKLEEKYNLANQR